MLRQPARGVRIPLKAFSQPTQQAAWNGAWRRLFTTETGAKLPSQLWRRRMVQFENIFTRLRFATAPRRGFRFSARRRADVKIPAGKEETLSLSQRLKKLSKEYGWAAVAVYFGLSVLDFPFCFLFVRAVGADKIGMVEEKVVDFFKGIIPEVVQHKWREYWASVKKAETDTLGSDDISDKVEMAGWGVEKASERNKETASLATQLALAYAIHKSFIFFRVPLTAWVTPKIVKTLRSWGYKIGKKPGA